MRSDNHFCRSFILSVVGSATFRCLVSIRRKKPHVLSCFLFFPVYAEHAGQPTDNKQRLLRREAGKKNNKKCPKWFEAGLVFNGIGDSKELYPKHWNVRTLDRGSHPPHLQEAHSSLLWPPIEPRQTAGTPARQAGCSRVGVQSGITGPSSGA